MAVASSMSNGNAVAMAVEYVSVHTTLHSVFTLQQLLRRAATAVVVEFLKLLELFQL